MCPHSLACYAFKADTEKRWQKKSNVRCSSLAILFSESASRASQTALAGYIQEAVKLSMAVAYVYTNPFQQLFQVNLVLTALHDAAESILGPNPEGAAE